MAGALTDQPAFWEWYICLRMARAKQQGKARRASSRSRAPSRNAINSDRQCPMERAVGVALRRVTWRHSVTACLD